MDHNDKDWSFTYRNGSRSKVEKTVSLPSGYSERKIFVLDRDVEDFIVSLCSVEDSSADRNEDKDDQVVMINYFYNADGSMGAE